MLSELLCPGIRGTDGALFRGRYKAKIIEEDSYLLVVSRYIHLNPMEAGLVTDLAKYKWSSYSAYIKTTKTPKWLTTNVILNYISSSASLAHIDDYKEYVEKYDMDEIKVFAATRLTLPIIGSDIFKEKLLSQVDLLAARESAADIKRISTTPSVDFIANRVCEFYKIDLDALQYTKRGCLNWPRLVFMYICRKYFGYSLLEIGRPLGCSHRSMVSVGVLNCSRRLRREPERLDLVMRVWEFIGRKGDFCATVRDLTP